jgi:hypothetical protein
MVEHPGSNRLLLEQPASLNQCERDDVSAEKPMHRHLAGFNSYVLRGFLYLGGSKAVAARGFGYYPLPRWLQSALAAVDPAHSHQMVLVCRKP